MNVGVIGVGRLGLSIALVFEKHGHDVLASSYKQEYVEALQRKYIDTTEPGVKEMLADSNIHFTVSNHEVIDHSEVIYLMVATPSLGNGTYDMSAVWAVVDDIKTFSGDVSNKVFIVACTTNPEVCQAVADDLKPTGISVAYSPVLVAQGSIQRNFQQPDLVLIGAADQRAAIKSKELFKSVTVPGTPIHVLGLTSAEIVKMALNCWTTMKISFANMIGQIMIQSGQGNEITQALRAIGDSKRCGQVAMQFGFGYGGPCLPRDNRSLYNYAREIGVDYELGNLVDQFNHNHAEFLATYFWDQNAQRLPFYFDHVSYKRGVTFTEESHQLKICKNILARGGQVIIEPTEYLLEETRQELLKEFGTQVQFERLDSIKYPVYKINI